MKIIDLRDSTGSGDVDISTIVKISSNSNREDESSIQGLSGRKLKVENNIQLIKSKQLYLLRFHQIGKIHQEIIILE